MSGTRQAIIMHNTISLLGEGGVDLGSKEEQMAALKAFENDFKETTGQKVSLDALMSKKNNQLGN